MEQFTAGNDNFSTVNPGPEALFYIYRISSVIRQSFFLPKQSQRSRSILQDGSRSLGLFRKGKIGIIESFIGLI